MGERSKEEGEKEGGGGEKVGRKTAHFLAQTVGPQALFPSTWPR